MTTAESLKYIENTLLLIAKSARQCVRFLTVDYNQVIYCKFQFIDGSILELRIYEDSLLKYAKQYL